MGLALGVNIDHVATVRQARGTRYPDVVAAAACCERAGAQGITVHLREDRRHIQDDDVRRLRRSVTTRLNLEMANSPEIVAVALDVRPDEVCLVPERRAELTTEGGLDVAGQLAVVAGTVARLAAAAIRVSLFIDPERRQVEAARVAGAPCIELHTGRFCELADRHGAAAARPEQERLAAAAAQAAAAGLQVNAGHGINLENLPGILALPHLHTLNIGHSIVARALFVGLPAAVGELLAGMAAYGGGGS